MDDVAVDLHVIANRQAEASCRNAVGIAPHDVVEDAGTGGRDGASRTSDGRLDVKLSTPGGAGNGTNPEQLFAAGWSACFMSAIGLAAAQKKVALPTDRAIDAEVDLGTNAGGFVLRARLHVSLPGLEREVAQSLVYAAHQLCPYSKATRGNIDVAVSLV